MSSRNPDYDGADNETIEFTLSNGQVDCYPMSWAISAEKVFKALRYFEENHKIPDFITWHSDYGE